jgi:hypothetical protein
VGKQLSKAQFEILKQIPKGKSQVFKKLCYKLLLPTPFNNMYYREHTPGGLSIHNNLTLFLKYFK